MIEIGWRGGKRERERERLGMGLPWQSRNCGDQKLIIDF